MTGASGSDDQTVTEALTRCDRTIRQLLAGTGDAEELDSAITDLLDLPDDLRPSPLAGALVVILLRRGLDVEPRHAQHIDTLLEIVDRDPPPWPQWSEVRMAAQLLAWAAAAKATLGGMGKHQPPDLTVALAELDKLHDLSLPAEVATKIQPLSQIMRTTLASFNDFMHDDEAGLRRLPEELQRMRELIDDPELAREFGPAIEVLRRWPDLLLADRRGDLPDAGAAARDLLQDWLDAVPPHRRADDFVEHAAYVEAVMARLRSYPHPRAASGPATAPTSEQVAALKALAARSDISAVERASTYQALGTAELWRGPDETDVAQIDRAIGYYRRALAVIPVSERVSIPGSWSGAPGRVIGLLTLAAVLGLRSTVTGHRDNLVEAEHLLTEARELAGGPQSAFWWKVNDLLATFRSLLGDTLSAPRTGLDGLRRYAWKVLLQSDTAAATAAARNAASAATRIAHSFLAAGDPAGAIQALDAGRALVLFAATEFRDIPTRLDAMGRSSLADRWRAATTSGGVGTIPVELRWETQSALSTPVGPAVAGTPGTAGPLDPPSLPEIQSALAALDADALVYLVPATPAKHGCAVIAPVQGPPGYMELPGLSLDDESDVGRYLTALSLRDAAFFTADQTPAGGRGPAGPIARDLVPQTESRFCYSLDALCDWAWRAAIGPLLEYLACQPTRVSGRPPRLVLVPMGSLSRIPWQAARRPDGTYAVQLAAFSQAASARMLCESAARTPVPLTPLGLVVGDPDTGCPGEELAAARIEAYAIHRSFYRGGRYVGRRPDGLPSRSGTGTPTQVRTWLTSMRPGAGAMLHLACHGVVEVGSTDMTSYLLLAGRERLTAEELIGVLAETPERAIGLVVLAACRTGVSSRGYDEAYSLGTAFLAAGVRSVLSTQWSVPDQATSVLMFMFHHFLMAERQPVWNALRQAQLWMLDPDRQPPEEMPPQLRQHLHQTNPAEIVAWAGFVHWGR